MLYYILRVLPAGGVAMVISTRPPTQHTSSFTKRTQTSHFPRLPTHITENEKENHKPSQFRSIETPATYTIVCPETHLLILFCPLD